MELKGREASQKLTFEEISKLNDRKSELKKEHASYLEEHPEIKVSGLPSACCRQIRATFLANNQLSESKPTTRTS